MVTNYPDALDTDANLVHVTEDHDVLTTHHNALKEAIKAIEERLGTTSTPATVTAIIIVPRAEGIGATEGTMYFDAEDGHLYIYRND